MKFTLFAVLLCLSLEVYSQVQEFDSWKKSREKELLAEDGWVNLAGLYWIDPENAFLNQVSSDSLEISAKAGKKNIGTFAFINDSVWFFYNPKLAKKAKLQQPTKTLQYPVDSYTAGGVYFEHWKWTVINRGGQFAMRLRDLEHPGLAEFQPIPTYEYNPELAVQAFFQPKYNETMGIPNVLGQIIEWKVMGVLKFRLDGKDYELTALDEAGKLFVIFSDKTNEKETYPTGRYLYVNYPDRNGNTRIDFNYSYNPPCAFTAFATCPIPPKVNRLEIAVAAGEKYPNAH
jgi:uncharacterized protein